MPRHPNLTRSTPIHDAQFLNTISVLEFLVPTARERTAYRSFAVRPQIACIQRQPRSDYEHCEFIFFSALKRASTCAAQRSTPCDYRSRITQCRTLSTSTIPSFARREKAVSRHDNGGPSLQAVENGSGNGTSIDRNASVRRNVSPENNVENARTKTLQWLNRGHETVNPTVNSWFPSSFFNDTSKRQFAELSRLPPDFFGDVDGLRDIIPAKVPDIETTAHQHSSIHGVESSVQKGKSDTLEEQVTLLKSVRELEEKLVLAKERLNKASQGHGRKASQSLSTSKDDAAPQVVLSKEDYMNLVDLYYYSFNSRFSPEATDMSPTPSFLDDHSFSLSSDFSRPDLTQLNEDEVYESPLKHVHDNLRSQKLKEIRNMQVFVDLLLDDNSSNRALYEAYEGLPQPGVAYLPTGVIRLFLQRMSTPWTYSEKSMLRYLSLIDDMQKENIPITSAEWSSAIYLAGRSFAKVTEKDVGSAFKLWQQMEIEAGVKSHHVTFNILFDIAVRAGKFALAQTVLMEMSNRNLRLNRLGRVSLIYYHGLRGDGDGVRKTYRDFVEAGEIVDTLVLNCVMASLYNAKEPNAAEQTYERMKSMYSRSSKGARADEAEAYYVRYPPPGEHTIGRERASNHLGRLLNNASRLEKKFPDHHRDLQASMPLIPDFTTFRTMIAYHSTKSGDLDRLSVILQEMTDVFNMPLRSLVFQFLFKGFALHGPTGGPDGAWSVKRLDLCWQAFRNAIKEGRAASRTMLSSKSADTKDKPVLPSITQVNAIPFNAPIPAFNPPLHNPPSRRMSGWNEFVLDLAAFPKERLRRIERFHAQMFDDENMPKPHESKRPHTFKSPFFQSTVYQAPEPKLDHEEGEYTLPNSRDTAMLNPHLRVHQNNPYTDTDTDPDRDFHDEHDPTDPETEPRLSYQQMNQQTTVSPTRPLICWLLRAYARNTKSRARVEEIWGVVRKMWYPRDAIERESVVRVLRRCLRDCDREGSG